MTTAAHAIAVAEQVRAAGLIYRMPSGYVSIQQSAPYTGANDRFGSMWVEHCGISVAFVLTRAGLRFGSDYPEGIQYSPLLARQLLTEGYTQAWAPGAIGVIDWGGAGYGATAASDHVVFLMGIDGDYATCWETNTTADGRAYYYRRHRSLFTATALPRYLSTPPTPTIDAARTGGFALSIGG